MWLLTICRGIFRMCMHATSAVVEHFAYATAAKVCDVVAAGGDVLSPDDWRKPHLQHLWRSTDARAIEAEPCAVCGDATGFHHMVLCDTCERPYHLQCCFFPRSVVPDGPFHCHVCDEKFSNMDEFSRPDDPILFAQRGDPHHHEHAVLLEEYVRCFESGLHFFSESQGSPCSASLYDHSGARRAAALFAEELFSDCDSKSL
jgi:hypothetical protein